MRYFVVRRVADLWKCAFRDHIEQSNYLRIRTEGLTGNKFHDEVIGAFLSE